MRFLNQTPAERITNLDGYPYFLWDCKVTLENFKAGLRNREEPECRAYLAAKLLRQAKPDDVFIYLTPQEIADLWPSMVRYLGKERDFWDWLLNLWQENGYVLR